MQQMENTRWEGYLAALLGLASVVFPVSVWLRGFLMLIVIAILSDIAMRSPLTRMWNSRRRIVAAVGAATVVVAASWSSLVAQYHREYFWNESTQSRFVE